MSDASVTVAVVINDFHLHDLPYTTASMLAAQARIEIEALWTVYLELEHRASDPGADAAAGLAQPAWRVW